MASPRQLQTGYDTLLLELYSTSCTQDERHELECQTNNLPQYWMDLTGGTAIASHTDILPQYWMDPTGGTAIAIHTNADLIIEVNK